MMDHVYICRRGNNEELRYSLRSLEANIEHEEVYVIGGWPEWLTGATTIPRAVPGDKHHVTNSHMQTACEQPGISDPFVLWHDDMYAMEPVEMDVWHNGVLRPRAERSSWAAGQRATQKLLGGLNLEPPLYSYDLHVPLIVHKEDMLRSLELMRSARSRAPLHKRTLYGNLAGLGGEYMRDCKKTNPRAAISGPWLSSADSTFRKAVLPQLQEKFPTKSRFEK